MLVMKFGGSSVADRTQIDKVRAIVQGRAARRPVVISSAHKGVTNALIAAGKAAAAGKDDAGADVIAKQTGIARDLGCSDALLAPLFAELRDLLRGVRLVKELSPRSLDYITSFGERMAVRVIADYFARFGEASFRDGERKVIGRLLDGAPVVLATGGGAFVDPVTRQRIKAAGVSVWIRADLDLLIKRTTGRDHRPLLKQGDPREILGRLMELRYPIYAEADIIVDSSDEAPEATVARVMAGLVRYLEPTP